MLHPHLWRVKQDTLIFVFSIPKHCEREWRGTCKSYSSCFPKYLSSNFGVTIANNPGGGGTWPKFVRGCADEKNIFTQAPESLPSNDTRFHKKSVKSILQNTKIWLNDNPIQQNFPFSHVLTTGSRKIVFFWYPVLEKIAENDTLKIGTSPSDKYTRYPPPLGPITFPWEISK